MKCTLNKEQLQFEWLMFDFDNTLVDFHAASRLAFDQCFVDHELEQKPEYYETYEKINAKYWKAFEEKKITALDIRKQRFKEFLTAIGINHLDGYAFNAKYLDNLVEHTTIRSEVKEMLQNLEGKYRLSIITNGLKEVQRPRLEKCGITSLFDSIIVSDEIGVAKPDTAFFEYAINSINHNIPKEKILVIGDSLHSDIAGAKAFGLPSCLISKKNLNSEKADIIIDDVLQLNKLLDDFYIPVDCGWYDYLEIYSMRKTEVEIYYFSNNVEKNFVGKIENLETKNKEEFAVLSNGLKLRLDKIKNIIPLN